jgi:hypothetical protein
MFSGTFALFLAPAFHFPGAPWILAALLLVASLIIAGAVVPSGDPLQPRQLAGADVTK